MELDLYFECDLGWDDFVGDGDFQRFCPRCEHTIHNVSALTRDEARAFFREQKGQKVCVTFKRRRGKVVFRDDSVDRLHQQREGVRQLVFAAALVSPLLVLGCEAEPRAIAAGAEVVEVSPDEPGAGRAPSTVAHHATNEPEAKAACDPEPPALVRAKRAIEQMFDDLYETEEERRERESAAVISGGNLF